MRSRRALLPLSSSAAGAAPGPSRPAGRPRQPELLLRPFADLAVDMEGAAGLAGEAVDHGEAEAGALADLLGGEEGLGHLLQYLGRDAAAGIGDGEHDIIARRQAEGLVAAGARIGAGGRKSRR